MGAMIMFGLVSLIAIVGGGYYYLQDRKEAKREVHSETK